MNASSSPRTDGDNAVTCNDRNAIDEIGERLGEMEFGETSNHTSLSTLPDTVLLNIFSFILSQNKPYIPLDDVREGYCREQLKLQLAIEKTCRRFSAFLGQDTTMRLLYQNLKLNLEFSYQVETMREKLFISNGLRMALEYQATPDSPDNLICNYMGGADGVRCVIDKILMTMERQCDENVASARGYYANILRPPAFPENGFKLFLRGDSIAYLTEVVEQHMVYRLNNAWTAALFRSNPKERHPYPMLCENDIMFVDAICTSDFGTFHSCNIFSGRHCCRRLSFSNSPEIWEWPEDNCLGEDIFGADQRQRMVRAIASRAGIIKLSGALFDSIAAEILHFMAAIVIDAFEGSKSLWYPQSNIGIMSDIQRATVVGDIFSMYPVKIDDEIIGEESDNVSDQSYLQYDYITNHPPPPRELDEDGKYVCVIIPRQIKDAAVRLGMKPLLDDQRWEVSEGRTKKEEMSEALSLYGLSLDDDSSSSLVEIYRLRGVEVGSDGESVWQPNSADEADSDSDSEEWSSADEADIDI